MELLYMYYEGNYDQTMPNNDKNNQSSQLNQTADDPLKAEPSVEETIAAKKSLK